MKHQMEDKEKELISLPRVCKYLKSELDRYIVNKSLLANMP